MTQKKGDGSYVVGHSKPPKDTQFKKGESGNRKGRPPGAKNKPRPDETACIIEEEGRAMMDVKVRGKAQKMPTKQAITKAIFNAAASGNTRAQRIAMDLLMKTENKRRDERAALFAAAVDYKNRWADESKERRRLGLPDPRVPFHPDSYVLNYEAGEVTCVGMTPEQEKVLEMFAQGRAFYQTALWELAAAAEKGGLTEADARGLLEDFVTVTRALRAMENNLDLGWSTDCFDGPDLKKLKELSDKVLKDLKSA